MGRPKLPDENKNCLQCQKPMERKRFPSSLEDRACFQRRKYCDQLCMAKHFIKEKVTLAALRKRAEKFRGTECAECKTTKNLAVHHLDENPANNATGNLMTLCGSCHTKWHWRNGKRIVSGRKKMMARLA